MRKTVSDTERGRTKKTTKKPVDDSGMVAEPTE